MRPVNEFLSEIGYRAYMCSADGRYISFVQEENFAINVICLYDEMQAASSNDQFAAFEEEHRRRLGYGRDKDIHFLRLINADYAYVVQRMETAADNEWFIEPVSGRLFIPEGAMEDFYGLKMPLWTYIFEEGFEMPARENLVKESEKTMDAMEKAPAREGVPVTKKKQQKEIFVPWLTAGLILTNVMMYITQESGIFDERMLMLKEGISGTPAEWYRFLTYSLLHADILHIANNMFVLYAAGSMLEEKCGRAFTGMIYLISGIAGGIVSVWSHTLKGEAFYGLGASGAVYGVTGAIVAIMLLSKEMRSKGNLIRIMIAVFLMLYAGRDGASSIDYMCHAGGFAAGFIISGIVSVLGSFKGEKSGSREED